MGLPFDLENALACAEIAIEKATVAENTVLDLHFDINETDDCFKELLSISYDSASTMAYIAKDYISEAKTLINQASELLYSNWALLVEGSKDENK